jgi:hypothetical protein
MNNALIQLKIKQRLNKLDSQDYDNIECWQISEAFNKAQLEWVRFQLIADESTKQLIDNIQMLLTEAPLILTKSSTYDLSQVLPADYIAFKRVSVKAVTECCTEARPMTVYLAEVANVDVLLRDVYRKPNFDWAETFCTLSNNRLRIYVDDKMTLSNGKLTYYRTPQTIKFANCPGLNGELLSVERLCEFRDDIVEEILEKTVVILSADLEQMNRYQTATQAVNTP